jgi:photosystem II stability/assembly factor-like uncharacterized protein
MGMRVKIDFLQTVRAAGLLLGVVLISLPLRAMTWFPLGPYGGDVRSFAVDPQDAQHLYLGTATGWIYESHNNGRSWVRLAQLDKRDDMVVAHIVTDPADSKHLIVAAYIPASPTGGLFVSDDGGKSWFQQAEMHGQSVRSLARSVSDPKELVSGTLTGVFMTTDNGVHWHMISPEASTEIHEVESVAIDPVDPRIIYAGTWHLPWKTVDGGAHWKSIKQGIIEDSDVFSIIIDPKKTNVVYASACSGIYKSTDAGLEFRGGVTLNREQGLPVSARRTRKLAQDPEHRETVYAGTTEGLYRTLDSGAHWDRLTPSDVIVNDVYIDPKDSAHLLLATDRGGVLSSDDMGATFHPSNAGFSARQVSAYAPDPRHSAVVYVGVVNDKETGGVFRSGDGGVRWEQMSLGLGGRDVFSLASTSDGVLLAGTAHGVFRYGDGVWTDSSAMEAAAAAPKVAKASVRGKRPVKARATAKAVETPTVVPTRMDAEVHALLGMGDAVYAGTSQGLMKSVADGLVWTPVTSLAMPEVRYLAGHGALIVASGLKRVGVSTNNGLTWRTEAMPRGLTQISSVAVDDEKRIWVGGGEGVFVSADNGLTWTKPQELVVSGVNGLYFDTSGQRMLVTSFQSNFVYAVHVPDGKVTYWDSGWKLRFARPVGDHLIGATLYDGVVVQPVMVAEK